MGAIFWILAALIAVIALALHLGAVFASGKLSEALSYLNVSVHLFALLFLLYNKVSLDASLLSLMTSVLIYLIISYVKFNTKKRREEDIENDL